MNKRNLGSFVITRTWLKTHTTKRGGYTKAQIKALGLSYPLLSGWMDELVGTEISAEAANAFEDSKSVYSNVKGVKFKKLKSAINSLKDNELKAMFNSIRDELES
jgi:hypothetical protein